MYGFIMIYENDLHTVNMYELWNICCLLILKTWFYTVDGRHPAPPGMYKTL